MNVDHLGLPQAQPGQTVAVKIDAANPQVIYPAVPWATFNGVDSHPCEVQAEASSSSSP